MVNAMKSDVKKSLSRYVKTKPKQTQTEFSVALYELWVKLLHATALDPSVSNEEKVKLLFFWHKVCNPKSNVNYSQFVLFNNKSQLQPMVDRVDVEKDRMHAHRLSKVTANA
jgi:hypothetical protein